MESPERDDDAQRLGFVAPSSLSQTLHLGNPAD